MNSELEAIIAAILEEEERTGQPPNLDFWANQFPEYADQIRDFLSLRGRLNQLRLQPPTPSSAPTQPPGNATPVPGDMLRYFGDYELLEELARGGMGVVFRARQTTLNRTVALKMILSGQLAGQEEKQRFRREAEAAAKLDHPNIVPIYEVGEHLGHNYFSMKLIEGTTFSQAMKAKSLTENTEILVKVARAVQHAHQRAIIHRDLKPSNILIDAQGEPHVTDFGLAKQQGSGEGATQSGVILGTPSYMAPEQAKAQKDITTAVDVYALGAILYEVLTGKPPFQGPSSLDVITQVLEKEPQPPRMLNPRIDRDLETICLKCLEKEPEKRYPSVQSFAEELDRWLRHEPIQARSIPRVVRWWRMATKPAQATAATSVLALASVFVPLAWLIHNGSNMGIEREHHGLFALMEPTGLVMLSLPLLAAAIAIYFFTIRQWKLMWIPAVGYGMFAIGQARQETSAFYSANRWIPRGLSNDSVWSRLDQALWSAGFLALITILSYWIGATRSSRRWIPVSILAAIIAGAAPLLFWDQPHLIVLAAGLGLVYWTCRLGWKRSGLIKWIPAVVCICFVAGNVVYSLSASWLMYPQSRSSTGNDLLWKSMEWPVISTTTLILATALLYWLGASRRSLQWIPTLLLTIVLTGLGSALMMKHSFLIILFCGLAWVFALYTLGRKRLDRLWMPAVVILTTGLGTFLVFGEKYAEASRRSRSGDDLSRHLIGMMGMMNPTVSSIYESMGLKPISLAIFVVIVAVGCVILAYLSRIHRKVPGEKTTDRSQRMPDKLSSMLFFVLTLVLFIGYYFLFPVYGARGGGFLIPPLPSSMALELTWHLSWQVWCILILFGLLGYFRGRTNHLATALCIIAVLIFPWIASLEALLSLAMSGLTTILLVFVFVPILLLLIVLAQWRLQTKYADVTLVQTG